MNFHSFKTMLEELNPQEAAQSSILNHHVEGMDYLCLHRAEKLTVKLYFIDPARIEKPTGAFLVTPHTHRYAFESTVLTGTLVHETFDEGVGEAYERSVYEPETQMRVGTGTCDLWPLSSVAHGPCSSYWVGIHDIHTLIVPAETVLLGLVQFSDTADTSTVYVKTGTDMEYPRSRKPTPVEAWGLRNKALSMMRAA